MFQNSNVDDRTTFTRFIMDNPTKKRKETTNSFANKKPRLHQEAVNQYQLLNAEKAQEKARKTTHALKTPWTKEVRHFLNQLSLDAITLSLTN